MARIAVVTSTPPFTEGGHLLIARALVQALREAGHGADLVLTPQNRFGRQASSYLANRLTDVGVDGNGRTIDQIISLRYPSYAVKHARHVCWLNHRMREYYDLWERFTLPLSPRARLKERLRRTIIHRVDHYLLTRNVSKLFAQSATIQTRLQRWGQIPAEILYPPPPQRAYRCDDYEPYIFAVSRLMPDKRMDLLIEAFAAAGRLDLRCVIAGDGPERERLHALIVARQLQDRVVLLGWTADGDLLDHFARCRAVFFGPLDEDYGLVTLEAFRSAKLVITCADSGGPTELVTNNTTGFVCSPTAASVAECLNRLASDPELAPRMGKAAYREALKFSWEETVKKLVVV